MIWISRLRSLWRNLVHRKEKERDLDDEVRACAAILEDENAARGLSPEEARRQALIEMGGMEQVKSVREVKMGALLETVGQDVRYGLRTLARAPGFTVAAVLAVAWASARPPPSSAWWTRCCCVRSTSRPRLAVLLHRGRSPVAPANFLDWKRDASSFEAMGHRRTAGPTSGVDIPERVMGLHVTANLLPMLGVPPLIGRLFAPGEDAPGRDHTVVLGYRLWQRRFGGIRPCSDGRSRSTARPTPSSA